jgi:DNA-binding IscR family transcriptional regulator
VRAARGQTQAKVLAALRQTPGARTAIIASTTGLPTKAASATISRLVKQGRVRRLPQGGYALAEAASNGTETQAAQATTDAGPAATGSEEGARSVRVETRPPEADTPRRR